MLRLLTMSTLMITVGGARSAASRIMQQRSLGLGASLATQDRAAVVRAVGRERSRFLATARGAVVPTAHTTDAGSSSTSPAKLAELEAAAVQAEAAAEKAEAIALAAEAEAKVAAEALRKAEADATGSAVPSAPELTGEALAALEAQIAEQGNKVRDLKAAAKDGKAEKADVDAAVAGLLELKAKLPAGEPAAQQATDKGKNGKKKKNSKAAEVVEPVAADGGPTMDEVINVCKRRGIIFQSSEVYGGYAGFFDYGPLGVELRANIKQVWLENA